MSSKFDTAHSLMVSWSLCCPRWLPEAFELDYHKSWSVQLQCPSVNPLQYVVRFDPFELALNYPKHNFHNPAFSFQSQCIHLSCLFSLHCEANHPQPEVEA